jgi:hypothetical protein
MDALLDHIPETLTTETFHFDEMEDKVVLSTEQDVTQIIEENKALQNLVTSIDRWGDMRRVAQVPLSLYLDLYKKGITRDAKTFSRWLNDPDNRFFRTSPGVI